ncbi:hypothetical protein HRI_003591200 [Hibiscus trionum]|uniref:Reverse transcriptase domain-containing protein n=1 Tax=Hibiscus trionum TaxID=183268 RepID=A0A9W7INA7_HIBTR|nr:hypothetical protein HRI_003591200 [Hibiscus trionum]
MERVRKRYGFHNGIDVEANGRSGGLSLGWKNSVQVTLRSFSARHIDFIIKDDSAGFSWRCTRIYGNPEAHRRHETWDLLKCLNDSPDMPWVILGDFNEILLASEKQGGLQRSQRQMDQFQNALEECELGDIGSNGPWFTWENGRRSESNMRVRLDRGVANNLWLTCFPEFDLHHLPHSISDHCPILLDTTARSHSSNKVWHFCFEASWLLEESCEATVRELWNVQKDDFLDKLDHVTSGLDAWFKRTKKAKKLTVEMLNQKLDRLNELAPSDEVLGDIVDTKLELNLEMDKDELYWEQRARSNWLQFGDRNTTYFHRSATQRKKKNKVSRLDDGNNSMTTDEGKMGEIAREYFTSLFNSKGVGDCGEILSGINRCITDEMNSALEREFTKDEVFAALNSMSLLKAAGADGLGVVFYKRFWKIVGDEVALFCIKVLKGEYQLDRINHTRIVLIPKVDDPSSMSNFRPISLCNVIYKIISKVLVIRFQDVLPVCIDEAQSAFVPGRLITDNVLAAFEILHSLRNKRQGKKSYFALKLDMSKAYDRVEWDFLDVVMRRMGFSDLWVSRIMKCVSTVTYSVVLNGNVGQSFRPSRGLRQGDPLSPFLFLICSEGLSSLLRKNEDYVGVRITRSAPRVSHLFFADDSLIFGECSARGARKIQDLLLTYASCSGQLVNFDKSAIFFSTNTGDVEKADVRRVLGITQGFNPEKYLGLPIIVGRNRKKAFSVLKDKSFANPDKIQEVCNSPPLGISIWCTKFLSQGGKEVLIKAVLQAIPVYTMSCFLLPKSFCQELEQIFANFWWQNSKDKRGIHWCTWSELSKLKEWGGLGFRDLSKFNVALLAKQGWRLLLNPSSLVGRLLRAKYYPSTSFLKARLGHNPSLTWRSIWSARGLLELGLRWKVGNGGSISVWNDFWLPGNPLHRVTTQAVEGIEFVSDLIDPHSNTWRYDLISSIFSPTEAEQILCIPLPHDSQPDTLVWQGEHTGVYSTRSGYRYLLRPSEGISE